VFLRILLLREEHVLGSYRVRGVESELAWKVVGTYHLASLALGSLVLQLLKGQIWADRKICVYYVDVDVIVAWCGPTSHIRRVVDIYVESLRSPCLVLD
jgi:hypothetical protein